MKFLILIASLTLSACHTKQSKADSLNEILENKFPGSKILTQTKCEMGASKTPAIGFLALRNTKAFPAIALQNSSGWDIQEIDTRISYKRGSISDFLSDGSIWNAKTGLNKHYEIKCAIPDQNEFGISTASNGAFQKPFLNGPASGKHICFQVDTVYNSWSCYGLVSGRDKIQNSFVQMNAD